MTRTMSRRSLLRFGGGTAATLGLSALTGDWPRRAPLAQRGAAANVPDPRKMSRKTSSKRTGSANHGVPSPPCHPRQRRIEHCLAGGSADGAGVSSARLDLPGFGRSRFLQFSGRCRALRVRRARARQGRRRVGAHRWRQTGGAIALRQTIETHPLARRRQRPCVRDSHDQRLPHSSAEQTCSAASKEMIES